MSQKKITHSLPLGNNETDPKKVWTTSVNSQGPTGPTDLPAALQKFREVKQEAADAGQQLNPTIRPDLQVRQRQGQQFQRYKDPNADDAATDKSDQATVA